MEWRTNGTGLGQTQKHSVVSTDRRGEGEAWQRGRGSRTYKSEAGRQKIRPKLYFQFGLKL